MTQKNEPGVYFDKLTLDEKQSKLSQLARSVENKMTVWVKGSKTKYTFGPIGYNRASENVQVIGDPHKDILNREVLVAFQISGLNFFGKCRLSHLESNKDILVNFSGDLFKSERRSNFRLLTYPHQNIHLFVKVPIEKNSNSNLISLATKTNEMNLFRNFLKLVGDTEDTKEREGHLKLRVLDISVTGLAIQLGEIEKSVFENLDADLGSMHLDFNGEMIEIPNGQMLYVLDFVAQDKKTKFYKGGIRFVDIDTNFDEKISSIINQTLRKLEYEFEDFLE